MSELRLVRGNKACALGAVAAGCRFYAGYPITPSTEVAEEMARRLPGLGGTFVQMEDEISSLAAVIGASLAGVKAMTATSGPGYSLMQEHIGYATMAEVPCVVVNVMRGGPSTGMPTFPSQADVMQTRWGTHGDHAAIVLAPASVREVFDLTVRAFNLAERFRNPVHVLYDEVIGHIAERVSLPDVVDVRDRLHPTCAPEDYLPYAANGDGIAPLPAFGDGYRFNVTGLAHDERGYPTTDSRTAGALLSRLQSKVDAHVDEIVEVEEFLCEDAEIVVFAYGIVSRAARDAVLRAREAGIRAGMLRPLVLWPFPDAAVAAVAKRAKNVLVAEMNLGQMLHEVSRATAGEATVTSLLRSDGELITPTEITDELMALPAPAGGVL